MHDLSPYLMENYVAMTFMFRPNMLQNDPT